MNFDYSNPKNIKYIMDWTVERYKIHKKKDVLKQPAPWTDKKGFDVRYCNVMRRHDRESINVIKGLCLREDLTLQEKMLNILIFRTYNKYQTFELMGFPHKGKFTQEEIDTIEKNYKKFMEEHPDYGVFTGAFMVTGMLRAVRLFFERKKPELQCDNAIKIIHLYNHLCDVFNTEQYINAPDIKTMIKILMEDETLFGFGKFLRYQVYLDWCYCPEWNKNLNEDQETISGPGCDKGIWSSFTGREISFEEFNKKLCEDGMTAEDILKIFRDNTERYLRDYGEDPNVLFDDLPEDKRTIILSDWENIMCEFSKYFTYRFVENKRGSKLRHYSPVKRFDTDDTDW